MPSKYFDDIEKKLRNRVNHNNNGNTLNNCDVCSRDFLADDYEILCKSCGKDVEIDLIFDMIDLKENNESQK